MPKIAVVIPKYGLVGGAEQFAAELTGKLCSRHQDTFQVFAKRWQSNFQAIGFSKIPIISFPLLYNRRDARQNVCNKRWGV